MPFALGCVKSPPDPRDWIYDNLPLMSAPISTTTSQELPEEFDLRGSLPPVRDQGQLGTCAAFSASCIKEYHEKIDNPTLFSGYMSPFFIYCNRVNKPAEGMYLRDVMRILQKCGSAREQFLPYSSKEPKTIPPTAIEDAARFKIANYAQVMTVEAAKRALMVSGPLLAAFPYYDNGLPEFWKPKPGVPLGGGHAVTIVGWNKVGFIVRNSWGSKWNGTGHVIYSFEDFNNKLHWEIWSTVDLSGSKIPVPPPQPRPRPNPFRRLIRCVGTKLAKK
jgi:C1A family cysteine protease